MEYKISMFQTPYNKAKMSDSPRTPLRNLQPGGDQDNLRRTPGGLSMDIVLTPALRPPPSK